ncbi:ciliary-associated calcium-binding coiled-coil protein 1-like [Diadema setosum]|uniref:ciliary-associated calcium-binding coiled-coil protein 1-like n=1 Tax=Diadema setosum TaxID=31175 RepID=UPI003B3A3EED
MASKKGKGKTSQISIQPTGKGPEAYKDVNWKTMTDDEAKAVEKDDSLAWKVLTNTQVQDLMGLPNVEEVEKKIAQILQLTNYAIDLKEATLLDYYVSAFWWAKEEGFDAQQTSGFFTVVHTLMSNVKDNLSASQNLEAFRNMLVGIGTESSETNGGLDFLNVKQAKLIGDYLESTLFQHYSLYYFLHHVEREEQIVCTDLCVEVLPPASMPYPPPLDEGLEEAVFIKHLAPPVPTEEEEKETAGDKPEETEPQTGDGSGDSAQENDADVTKDILAGVTVAEVQDVFDKVAKEMFAGLQDEIALKLREREADIITRINRIHKIAET